MAADRESETRWQLSKALTTRRGPQLVMRGRKLWKGALCLFHNGRAMPAASFDNANTVLNGGPLNVAGADANGGLRLIARVRNVKFQLSNGTQRVQATYASGVWTVAVLTTLASDTALSVAIAILSNAQARALLDVNFTGDGTGLTLAQALTDVPHVGIAGICKKTIDHSAVSGADLDVTGTNYGPLEFDLGYPRLVGASGSAPTANDVGSRVSVVDDWQLSTQLKPLQIALPCVDFSPEYGPAVDLLAQPF